MLAGDARSTASSVSVMPARAKSSVTRGLAPAFAASRRAVYDRRRGSPARARRPPSEPASAWSASTAPDRMGTPNSRGGGFPLLPQILPRHPRHRFVHAGLRPLLHPRQTGSCRWSQMPLNRCIHAGCRECRGKSRGRRRRSGSRRPRKPPAHSPSAGSGGRGSGGLSSGCHSASGASSDS